MSDYATFVPLAFLSDDFDIVGDAPSEPERPWSQGKGTYDERPYVSRPRLPGEPAVPPLTVVLTRRRPRRRRKTTPRRPARRARHARAARSARSSPRGGS